MEKLRQILRTTPNAGQKRRTNGRMVARLLKN
jgi:hypothetical protein